jgi:hypothetical protein
MTGSRFFSTRSARLKRHWSPQAAVAVAARSREVEGVVVVVVAVAAAVAAAEEEDSGGKGDDFLDLELLLAALQNLTHVFRGPAFHPPYTFLCTCSSSSREPGNLTTVTRNHFLHISV